MKSLLLAAVLGAIAQLGETQSLLEAIKSYRELSNFTALYISNPQIVQPPPSDPSINITILIPSNDAFSKYETDNGAPISALGYDDLTLQFQYQTMVGEQTAGSFAKKGGLTVPTLLTDKRYDNRTAGPALLNDASAGEAAQGQVVVVTASAGSPTKFRVRQNPESVIRSGLSSDATVNAVDSVWDHGRFQIVDKFFVLPQPCSNTIRGQNLTSLDRALNRTSLSDTLDHTSNVTCLGPNDNAFSSAGNPDSKLDKADLSNALLFHTIGQPLYSTYLEDGQSFTTLNNATVYVSIRGDDIYFNDAKIVNANVLTNNGLMHVLDKVMSPNGTAPAVSSSASSTISPTGSSTTTSPTTKSSTGAAAANIVALGPLEILGIAGLTLLVN